MTQTMNAWFSLTLLRLIVASAAPAAAQKAGSFEQLAVLVESGDRITVTDSSGREHSGRIIDLSPSGLELWTDGAHQDFREAHVHTVSQMRQDTLRNGAWFGLAVGAMYFIPKYDIGGRYAAMFFGLWAAAGTGVGVGLDALVPSRQVIYQPTGAARRVTAAPLLASNRRGLAVSFGL